MTSPIHPTAIIDSTAQIDADVTIGPYSIVEAGVVIGAGCRIGAHVTLGERLTLGQRVKVSNYACLGTASQDLKHRGEISNALVGDDAVIREFVTVNRGTREGGVTRVGARVVLLAYVHVAHECVIHDEAVLVNAATLGGEVHIGRRSVIGGLAGIHQFCRIGEYSIIGAGSKVNQDVPPFLIADGHPARPYGPNKVGLERGGFSAGDIDVIRQIYRILFDRGRPLEKNLAELSEKFSDIAAAQQVIRFCQGSRRGVARPRPRANPPAEDSMQEEVAFWLYGGE